MSHLQLVLTIDDEVDKFADDKIDILTESGGS